jgi:mono/diheme cytochrome c family protein
VRRIVLFLACAGLLAGVGCDMQDMYNQPKYKPLQKSTFFADERSSRPIVPDTVPRSGMRTDELLYTGKVNGVLADEFPFPITQNVLDRGRLEFNIFCSVCHGRTGEGNGMIVQRGFKRPPSYNLPRLRQAPAGHFFDVITNGFGAMYSYNSRISPRDRWAIVAYIRALQLSQHASIDDVPVKVRSRLEAEKNP